MGTAITRGELARRTGCNLETIRYYEKIGLMPDPDRSASGYRQYELQHVQRLRFIMRSRQLGFSLDDIRVLLRLVDGGGYTCGEVKDMTLIHIADIRRKIDDLRRMERVLHDMAAKCDGGDVPECPILEALSE